MQENIWLIEHASYICTDSFHACVFSIIFNKQFLAFRRCEEHMDKMFGRIETLFHLYNINREFRGDIMKIDENYFPKDISKEKKESIEFLEKAFDISLDNQNH